MKRSVIAVVFSLVLAAGAFAVPRRAPVVPFFAYISETAANTVAVHDLQIIGYPLITSIVVGANPQGVAVVPSLQRAYVVNNGSATVSVIDTATMSVAGTIAPPNFAQAIDVLVTPDQQWIFVSGQDVLSSGGVVFKISTATNTIMETMFVGITNGPVWDLAIQTSPFNAIYATHPNAFVVGQIRFGSGFASPNTGITEIGFAAPKFIDVAPDGSKAYLTRTPGISPAPEVVSTNDWSVVAPTAAVMAGVPNGVGTGDDYNEIRFHGTGSHAYVARNFISINQVFTIDSALDQGVGGGANTATVTPNTISIDPTSTILIAGTLPASGDTSLEVFDITTPDSPVSFATIPNISAGWRVAFGPPNPKPVVSEIDTHGSPAAGGGTIGIFGSGYSAGATVSFGGTPSPSVMVVSSSEIRAVVPAIAGAARYDVIVTNPDTQQDSLPGWIVLTPNTTSNSMAVLPGTTQSQYRMLSVPQVTSWSQLIQCLEAAFGPYDPQVWRAFWWDPAAQAYHELTTAPQNPTDVMGTSIWILARFGGTAMVPGVDSEWLQPPVYFILKPGWNMISWPMNGTGPGDWIGGANPVQVTQDFSSFFIASLPNALVNSLLYEWDGTQYVSTSQMQIGRGYWVQNQTSGLVYMSCYDPSWKPGETIPPPVTKALAPGDPVPPPPPGGASASSSSSSRPDCSFAAPTAADPVALLGLLLLALIAAARCLRR